MAATNKTALLDAAKQLVGERGYAATSVRDLASASGANLAAVNYHFGSREKLLNQAVLESLLEWTDRLAGAARADPGAGPLERMLSSLRSMLDEFEENEALFVVFLEALLQSRRSPELHDEIAEHYREQRRRVGEIVSASLGDRELPERTVEVVASVLLAVADGLLLQSLVEPAAIPTGDELTGLAHGIAALAAGGRRGSG